jgi:hypothetical protein
MYIYVDPKVNEQPLSSEAEQLERVRTVAAQLESQFPWNGVPHKAEISEMQTIYLTWWGPLDLPRINWLNASTDIYHWTYSIGGSLVLPDQAVTIETYPCQFCYQGTSIPVQLDICQRIGNYLHLNGGPGIRITTDGQLRSILAAVGIPLEGWTRTIWLCDRCDQPGATQSDFKCPSCQVAYEQFMQAPLAQLIGS